MNSSDSLKIVVAAVWGISGLPRAARHREEIAVLRSSNLRIKLLIRSLAISGFFKLAAQCLLAFAVVSQEVIFNTTSLLTGTGYASSDYGQWGNFAICLLFIVLFIGGCAGSTSCGLKVFRVQVVLKSLRRQVQELA